MARGAGELARRRPTRLLRRRAGRRRGSCRGSRCWSTCAPSRVCTRSAPRPGLPTRPAYVTPMTPFECALAVGSTTWQLTHAIALDSAGAVCALVHVREVHASDASQPTQRPAARHAWFRSAPATLTAGGAVAGRAGGGRDHRDGSVDVGGEGRAGDGSGGGGEIRVAGAVAGRAGGVGRVAEASGRVAVAGGAVHRRVGVPGDGGGGGAGERGVAAVAPGRRAGERRAGDRRRRDGSARGGERAPGHGDRGSRCWSRSASPARRPAA